ncbi:putative FBD domain, leucine-rich repeat domain, L domain-containing protein [Medicago truncatula]|uniref:Putative FBD domain, leucine-rich repeat domain, L domain-containing protein n=1 Tax=Medicago truncatula TaxID=3880 RepID=A0A396GVN0_MEDTR|nr:putative FBD domain, leucine-rich repeat domain, L domain-containing protein [Medicago truncatula]
MHYWQRMIPHLPYSILTCETLVVLKLSFLNMGKEFNITLVTLPSLKTLHLKYIRFQQGDDLIFLTDNCPNLEDLLLFDITYNTYCSIQWAQTLTKLKRADIMDCDFYIPMETVSNAEFLRIKLHEWSYRGCKLPTFHNLTHLVLCYNWDIVPRMLHLCPKLQNLDLFQHIKGSFWEDGYFGEYENEKWSHPKSVPGCLSSNLRTCTIRDFAIGGLQSYHIMLAKFILKNSTVLENMSIWCFGKQSEIERRLTSCSRASATCQLSIYNNFKYRYVSSSSFSILSFVH